MKPNDKKNEINLYSNLSFKEKRNEMVFHNKLAEPDYSELIQDQVGADVEVGAEFNEDAIRRVMRDEARRIVWERNAFAKEKEREHEAEALYNANKQTEYVDTLRAMDKALYIAAAFSVFFWYSRNVENFAWVDVAIVLPGCLLLLVISITHLLLVKDFLPECCMKGLIVYVFVSAIMTGHHIYNILRHDSAIIFPIYGILLTLLVVFIRMNFPDMKKRARELYEKPRIKFDDEDV